MNSSRKFGLRTIPLLLAFIAIQAASAEICITQSAIDPVQRQTIADAASNIAALIQANNSAALHASVVGEVAKDFSAFQYLVSSTAPKLAGGVLTVDQVYLLDASMLQKTSDGANPDAQFFCSLNRTTMETEFLLPGLPPGTYAFAIVNVLPPANASTPAPYRLSLLLRLEQKRWLLAGIYPRPETAAGHNGLWYWVQARQFTAAGQPWNAWLYYQAAEKLLQPADFVLSTHLDKLRTEANHAAPPALSEGVSVDAPLVVKAADGTEYRFTGLTVNDSLGPSSLDIEAHLRVDTPLDPAAARKRNDAAAAALLAAYPELRKPFHGVWIYAEAPGQSPFATEQPMSQIK